MAQDCPAEEGGPWYRDPKLLKAEYDRHGSLERVSEAHPPVHRTTLALWWRKHAAKGDLQPLTRGAKPPKATPYDPSDRHKVLLAALKKLGDETTVEAMSDATGLLPKQIRSALEELGHQGYRVETAADVVRMHRTPPPSETMHEVLFDGDHYRFAVVSDTHMGSKHERLEELHVAYDRIQAEGITTVYHPGDLVCGYGIFPNQVSTVKLHTYEEQVEYAALNYPARDGVTTEIIAGNHDIEGAFGRIGANPVEAVCNRRSDMVYGGAFHTTYKLAQGTRIYMLHPKGGTAYAVSYKAQKIAEGFEAGSKPNVVLLGHWHKRGDFEWRSVQLLLAGCFEGGGSFGARLGLGEPAVGFHIVDLWIADDGSVVRWRPEWFKFFPGRGFAHAT